MLTVERLTRDIELLRHGGSEGIALFMRTAQEFYQSGGEGALQNWLTVATPALPEWERTVVLTALFSSIFHDDQEMPNAVPAGTTRH